MTDTFPRSIWVSVMIHLCVAMLLFLRAILIPDQTLMIRDAIRVDVVGLPQKMTELPAPATKDALKAAEPPKAPATKKEVVKEPPKPKAPQIDLKKKDTTKSQMDALRKLERMKALDEIKKQIAQEKAAASAKPKATATAVAGNKLSAGNALTGLDKIEYDGYLDSIKSKIFANWSLPSWLSDTNYQATVTVMIDERGYVIKKVMRRPSGNDIFDTKCLEAIDASSPFPEPPERLRGLLSTGGINFNFPQ